MSEATPFGIYLHIPYCKAKCRYCDFYSAPGARGVPQSYVDALLRELAKNTRCTLAAAPRHCWCPRRRRL